MQPPGAGGGGDARQGIHRSGQAPPGSAGGAAVPEAPGGELTAPQKASNREVSRHRVVVEHPMAQLNRFTVLRQVFRGERRERHSGVIRVVAVLVNRRIAGRPLKTDAA